MYRGADKSLARPGKKQATATEDFEFMPSWRGQRELYGETERETKKYTREKSKECNGEVRAEVQ
jgi:hypothetical protein